MAGWYYSVADKQLGPIDDATLKKLASVGQLTLTTLVCHSEKTKNQWVSVDKIPTLKKLLMLDAPLSREVQVVDEKPQQPIVAEPAEPINHPVAVVVQGSNANYEQLSSGGWFARAFSSTAGIMIAVALFFIGVPMLVCAGCMTLGFFATAGSTKPVPVPAISNQPSSLPLFVINTARFYYSDNAILSTPVIELSVTNNTRHSISRAYFEGRLMTPGRSIPWVEDKFNYEIPGGVEPGESKTWELSPNMFGEWSKAPKNTTDLKLQVKVLRLDDENGNSIP